jgi:hypothetical protein
MENRRDIGFSLRGFCGRFVGGQGFEGQMVEATEKMYPKAGVKKTSGSGFPLSFKFREGLDQSVSDLVERILPLGEYYRRVHWFVRDRFDYGYGLVNHAFVAVLRELMKDYMLFVAQLETMFREKKLSLHKLWFFVQPALKTMELLDSVVKDVIVCPRTQHTCIYVNMVFFSYCFSFLSLSLSLSLSSSSLSSFTNKRKQKSSVEGRRRSWWCVVEYSSPMERAASWGSSRQRCYGTPLDPSECSLLFHVREVDLRRNHRRSI